MKPSLPHGWQKLLGPVLQEIFFVNLINFLDAEVKNGKTIYPESRFIFRALEEVDYENVKVVIIGQDPYHGPGQAIGRSFAVPNDLFPKPPSLQNIFKELKSDLGITVSNSESDLSGWAKQGVLLLNTVLTVEANQPFSHRDQGWEQFTHRVINFLNERKKPLVFILWGSHAQKLKGLIDHQKHSIIESAHPSPLSAYRGFFGSKVFSNTNERLKKFGESPVDWKLVSDS